METAIHSDASVLSVFEELKKQPEVKTEQNTTDEIKRIASDTGWKAMQSVIDVLVTQLSQMQGMVMPTDTVEAIGFRYLACQVAVERLMYVRNLPESYVRAERRKPV